MNTKEAAALLNGREYTKEITRDEEAVWNEEGFSWLYRTDIPHETFTVMEDGDTYCRGVVFKAEDAA